MKKILFILILLGTTPVFAYSQCAGGTEITTTDGSNITFCVGPGGMNWWSAVSWCDSNGGRLATKDEACGDDATSCERFSGYNALWTSTVTSSTTAIAIGTSSTTLFTYDRSELSSLRPLCK